MIQVLLLDGMTSSPRGKAIGPSPTPTSWENA
jgi:hypothetical protein